MKTIFPFLLMLIHFTAYSQQFLNGGFEVELCNPQSCSNSNSTMNCVEGWFQIENTNNALLQKPNCPGDVICSQGNALYLFHDADFGFSGSVKTKNPMFGLDPVLHVMTMDLMMLPGDFPGSIRIRGISGGSSSPVLGFVQASQELICEKQTIFLDPSVVNYEELSFAAGKLTGVDKDHNAIIDNVNYCGKIIEFSESCGFLELSYSDCADQLDIQSITIAIDTDPVSELLFLETIDENDPYTTFNFPEAGDYTIYYEITLADGTVEEYTFSYTIENDPADCCDPNLPGVVNFHFEHQDFTADDKFIICEDVFVDASASSTAKYHYYALWYLDDNGDEIPLGHTDYLLAGNPQSHTNITTLFEGNTIIPGPVTFIENTTYRLQVAIYDEGCEVWIKKKMDFLYVEEMIDFHFEHENGLTDTNFEIWCEDIYLDASENPKSKYHYYVLWEEVGGSSNFLARTPYLLPGSPNNPENITDIFRGNNLLDWDSNPVPPVDFHVGTYKIQTAIYYPCVDDWLKKEHFFRYEPGDCCEATLPEVTFTQSPQGNCTVLFEMLQLNDNCNTATVTYYSASGEIINSENHVNESSIEIGYTTVNSFSSFRICFSFCGNNCNTSEEVCLDISAEMLQHCDGLLGENPRSSNNSEFRESPDVDLSDQQNLTEDLIKIYPNPSSGTLNFQLNAPGDLTLSVQVYSLDGKLVKSFAEEAYPDGFYKKNWSIDEELADGLYYVFFKTNYGAFQKKVVISKGSFTPK